HRQRDLGPPRGVERSERGRQRHHHAGPHEQHGESPQHLLVHRMNSGRRLMMSVEKLLITRSIHGNVSANTPKIAAARGMNASTLSWMDVTVWNRLTSTPAIRPASSIGRLTKNAISLARPTAPT